MPTEDENSDHAEEAIIPKAKAREPRATRAPKVKAEPKANAEPKVKAKAKAHAGPGVVLIGKA